MPDAVINIGQPSGRSLIRKNYNKAKFSGTTPQPQMVPA
jgi:hypothetical protein